MSTLTRDVVIRDFAYSREDPRHHGEFDPEIYAQEDEDEEHGEGEEDDAWDSFMSYKQPLDEQEKDSEFVQTVTTAKEFERMQIGMLDIDKNPQLTLQRGERAYGFNGEGSDDDMPPPSAHPDRHQQRRPSLESTGGDAAEIGAANGKQKGTDAAGQAATQQGNSSSATTGGTLAELDGKTSTILGVSKALYDFQAENPSELTFYENDRLYILYKQCEGWLVGYKGNQIGLIPENYVEFIS